MDIYLARATSTGTYHWAYGPQATLCSNSGPRRSPYVRPASGEDASKATNDMFCRKCFRNEKAIERARNEA